VSGVSGDGAWGSSTARETKGIVCREEHVCVGVCRCVCVVLCVVCVCVVYVKRRRRKKQRPIWFVQPEK